MKITRYSALALLLTAGSVACENNTGGTPTVIPPRAYVRYVNAVSDQNTLDGRFTDLVEGSPNFTGVQFRQFTPYQAVDPGARAFSVFVNPLTFAATATPTQQSQIAQYLVKSGTLNVTAGKYYTVYHVGRSGLSFAILPGASDSIPTGATNPALNSLVLVEDVIPSFPSPAPAQVAVRVANLGQAPVVGDTAFASLGNLDIYVDTGRVTPAAVLVTAPPVGNAYANVPPAPATGFVTSYVTLGSRAASAAAAATGQNCPAQTNTFVYWAVPAGTTPAATSASIRSCIIGVAGTTTLNGTGGAQTPGSVMTTFIFPAAPRFTPARRLGAAFRAAAVATTVDRNPPRTAP